MATKIKKPYGTSDITFAASLMRIGKKFVGAEPLEERPYESEFFFEDDGSLDDLFADFVNGDMRVDPNDMMNNLRNLKGRIR